MRDVFLALIEPNKEVCRKNINIFITNKNMPENTISFRGCVLSMP